MKIIKVNINLKTGSWLNEKRQEKFKSGYSLNYYCDINRHDINMFYVIHTLLLSATTTCSPTNLSASHENIHKMHYYHAQINY